MGEERVARDSTLGKIAIGVVIGLAIDAGGAAIETLRDHGVALVQRDAAIEDAAETRARLLEAQAALVEADRSATLYGSGVEFYKAFRPLQEARQGEVEVAGATIFWASVIPTQILFTIESPETLFATQRWFDPADPSNITPLYASTVPLTTHLVIAAGQRYVICRAGVEMIIAIEELDAHGLRAGIAVKKSAYDGPGFLEGAACDRDGEEVEDVAPDEVAESDAEDQR